MSTSSDEEDSASARAMPEPAKSNEVGNSDEDELDDGGDDDDDAEGSADESSDGEPRVLVSTLRVSTTVLMKVFRDECTQALADWAEQQKEKSSNNKKSPSSEVGDSAADGSSASRKRKASESAKSSKSKAGRPRKADSPPPETTYVASFHADLPNPLTACASEFFDLVATEAAEHMARDPASRPKLVATSSGEPPKKRARTSGDHQDSDEDSSTSCFTSRHVCDALLALEFPPRYASLAVQRAREGTETRAARLGAKRARNTKMARSGQTPEWLLQEQQRLFALAKQEMELGQLGQQQPPGKS